MLTRTFAAAALAAALPMPASAAPAPRMQVWEIVRTSAAPSKLAVSMNATYDDTRTILALTYLRKDRGGLKVLPGAHLTSQEGTSEPEVYAGGRRVACTRATGVDCTAVDGQSLMTAYYNDNGLRDPLAPTTIIAVTYGIKSSVSVSDAKQWRVRKVSRGARAVWSTDGSDAAGVWSPWIGGEVFLGAAVKGGSRGSVAIGVPPCAGQPVAVAGGAGTVRLEGGVAPVAASCPQDVLRPSQLARRATTWRLTGSAAGLTAELVSEPGTVRLLVVDF